MSRRYAPDHRLLVLKVVRDFKFNVPAAARYTRVPERTIRAWLQEEVHKAKASRRAAERRDKTTQRQHPPVKLP